MSPEPRTFRVATTRTPARAVLRPEGIDDSRRDELAHAAGLREGYARATEEAAGLLERAAERLDAAGAAAGEQLASTAIELALEIARSLLAAEVDAGRYDLERIVRDTLASSGIGRGPCTVHVNPEDHARLQGVRFRSGTVLEPDHEVARGDVHVTTPRGLLVRELDETLSSIRDSLMGEVE